MNYDYLIYLFIFNIFIYYIFRKKLLKFLINFKLVDRPGKNKIHKNIIPVTGGIIIFFSLNFYIIFNYLFFSNSNSLIDEKILLFFFSSFIIFFLGIVDDVIILNPKTKIYIIAVLSIVIFQNVEFFQTQQLIFDNFIINKNLSVYSIALFLTVFGFLSYHYSLVIIDGINGLLCSYLIGLFLILLIFFNLDFQLKNLLVYLILILLFVMYLNIKGDLFLGNSGSLMMATLAPYIIIYIYNLRENSFSVLTILSLAFIPILDMGRLFIKRIFSRKSPFTKDLNHLHHLLIKRFSLSKSLTIYQSLCFLPFILIALFNFDPLFVLIFQGFIFYLIIILINKKHNSF